MHPNTEKIELKYFNQTLGSGKFKEGDMHYVAYEINLDTKKMKNPFMYQMVSFLLNSNSQEFLIGNNLMRGLHLYHPDFCILISALESRLISGEKILITGGSRRLFKHYKFDNKLKFFYKTKHPFSQWYKCNFKWNDLEFTSAEQFMMFNKAQLFNDKQSAEMIMKTSDPKKQKEIGRKVKGFNEQQWKKKAIEIVYEGNYEKFNQNEDLKEALLATKGQMIIEASPCDNIWGIGLSEEDNQISDLSKWKGTNWLGIILTELRQEFLSNGSEDFACRPDVHNYWVNNDLNEYLEKYEW